MDSFKIMQEPETPQPQKLKLVVAILLLILGIIGVVWIANQVIILVTTPLDIPLIKQFMAFESQARMMVTIPNGTIELPASFTFGLGVITYIFALGVAVSITKLLITSCVNLLESQVKDLLNWIRKEILQQKSLDDKSLH